MDHILYWNCVALEVNRRDLSDAANVDQATPKVRELKLNSRALAMVHMAIYEAHAGVANNPTLTRQLATPPNPPAGASAAAAVAAAAHTCLSALFPRQKEHLDKAYLGAGLAGTVGLAEGHVFGLAVARVILKERATDRRMNRAAHGGPNRRGTQRLLGLPTDYSRARQTGDKSLQHLFAILT